MNDELQQVKDDISYMKQLASDDGSVLLASGIGLMVAGAVFGLAGLRQFLIAQGWLSWPEMLRPLMPFDTVVVFFVLLFCCFALAAKGKPQALPKPNAAMRAMWASWAAVGFGYLAVQFAFEFAGVPEMTVLTLFAFWGGGWAVVWAIYRQGWLLLVTLGCYVATVCVGAFREDGVSSLVFGLGFLLLVALPGLKIFRQARAIG